MIVLVKGGNCGDDDGDSDFRTESDCGGGGYGDAEIVVVIIIVIEIMIMIVRKVVNTKDKVQFPIMMKATAKIKRQKV